MRWMEPKGLWLALPLPGTPHRARTSSHPPTPSIAQVHGAVSTLSLSHPSPSLHRVPLSQAFHSWLVTTPTPFLFIPKFNPAPSPGSRTRAVRREPRVLLGCEWLRHLRDFLQERPAMSHWGWGHLDRKGAGGPFSVSISCLSLPSSP